MRWPTPADRAGGPVDLFDPTGEVTVVTGSRATTR
ncbi:hypothetical protein FHR93_005001 [Geodermatophilus sabuli]|nr:hypothetical protein [Geodermatophilus sabuli]